MEGGIAKIGRNTSIMLLLVSFLWSCHSNKNVRIKVGDHLAADAKEVSVKEFREFVLSTQYQTTADSLGWSGYFDTTTGKWGIAPKANWERIDGVNINPPNWPVTQVSYYDACAYCEWKKGRLPKAAEWNAIAENLTSKGNIWQGNYPLKDLGEDGFKGIAPTGSFLSNQKGFYDLSGNVWEWTSSNASKVDQFMFNAMQGEKSKIIKGGSYLCVVGGCEGFKPNSCQITPTNSGTNHLGFRCVYDL